MKLGAFSISLSVKNLIQSKEFYEKMGFSHKGGDIRKNYLIMKNGDAVIGLFHGMFEGNIITFNPGWNQDAKPIAPFDDVRIIQTILKNEGLELESESQLNSEGPGSFVIRDPDGNVILVDQHV